MALTYQPFEAVTDDLQMVVRRTNAGRKNVGRIERWASAIGGGLAVATGIALAQKRGQVWSAIGMGLAGAALIKRGVSGRCEMYAALGVDTSAQDEERRGIRVEKRVTINRPRAELYSYWRKLENLPNFMQHLESVRQFGDGRSHWVAKAPTGTVEWDAEIINERENELIAWQSLEGADIPNAGSVRFEDAGAGTTEVKVAFDYNPPGGQVGATVAKWFGEEPEQQVEDDLRRFKEVMEGREVAAAH
jgi:uncharacterized membrane protein